MKPKVKLLLASLLVTGSCVFLSRLMPEKVYLLQSNKTCACGECLSVGDDWFTQRLSRCPEPFLSTETRLSEEAFSWWKHLQEEKGTFSTYNKAVERLFQIFPHNADGIESSPYRRGTCAVHLQEEKGTFSTYNKAVERLFQIFPHNADGIESSPYRRGTCAVVGNSGNLKRSHYGPLIDYNDIIIRMNTGLTAGYEADVGSRTTHRVIYPESAMDLEDTTHLVLLPFKILDLEWLLQALTTGFFGRSYMPVKSKIKANKDLVLVVNPAFMKYVHNTWLEKKGRYPSTGFMTLVLALHICDEVNVFGYGADQDGNWNHYWEKLQDKRLKTGVHPGNQEYVIIEELAKLQKITFYKGW